MKHRETKVTTSLSICDYEGSRYRNEFWGGGQRDYEDLAERAALRALLPATGKRLADIGAGFGRLADLYGGYQQVILLDYSKSILQEAQSRLGQGGRFIYVVGNLYNLPLASGSVGTMVMVRVLHHLQDVPLALKELARIIASEGDFVLEYANKHHLKAMVRYLLHRQAWSPFDLHPYEFAPLHYDFHPQWIEAHLQAVQFHRETARAVSWFRIPLLKRWVGARRLAMLDAALQPLGRWLKITPSIFLRLRSRPTGQPPSRHLFRCPHCAYEPLYEAGDVLPCPSCGLRWRIEAGIYDFKNPLPP